MADSDWTALINWPSLAARRQGGKQGLIDGQTQPRQGPHSRFERRFVLKLIVCIKGWQACPSSMAWPPKGPSPCTPTTHAYLGFVQKKNYLPFHQPDGPARGITSGHRAQIYHLWRKILQVLQISICLIFLVAEKHGADPIERHSRVVNKDEIHDRKYEPRNRSTS